MDKDKKKSGFEDDPAWGKNRPCRHPEHNPPSHMVVPPGKIYRHVCPACGRESTMRSHGTFMQVSKEGVKNAL